VRIREKEGQRIPLGERVSDGFSHRLTSIRGNHFWPWSYWKGGP
jgi:hypothetical protein